MAAMQQNADVHYRFDVKNRVCVDMYARALTILDGSNPDCWRYEIVAVDNVYVNHAELVGDKKVEVKGTFSPLSNLTQMTKYNVYFDFTLKHSACGFNGPMTFEFTDPYGYTSRNAWSPTSGDNKVLVGQFVSNPSGQSVSFKLTESGFDTKKGLVVRRVCIEPAA